VAEYELLSAHALDQGNNSTYPLRQHLPVERTSSLTVLLPTERYELLVIHGQPVQHRLASAARTLGISHRHLSEFLYHDRRQESRWRGSERRRDREGGMARWETWDRCGAWTRDIRQ